MSYVCKRRPFQLLNCHGSLPSVEPPGTFELPQRCRRYRRDAELLISARSSCARDAASRQTRASFEKFPLESRVFEWRGKHADRVESANFFSRVATTSGILIAYLAKRDCPIAQVLLVSTAEIANTIEMGGWRNFRR